MALLIALSHLQVDAITAVAGNVEVDKVVKNVAKVLEVCDKKIPIYKGASAPIIKQLKTATRFHGEDGLADHPDIMEMEGYTDCIDEKVHAAQYLVKRAKQGNFRLICLGPLTNIALACCLYPKFATKIDRIYIMGGTVFGRGNAEFNREFNFAADPEAAHKVFKKFKNIHLVPWEASPNFAIPEEDYEHLQNPEFPKAKFLAASHSGQMKRLNKMMI